MSSFLFEWLMLGWFDFKVVLLKCTAKAKLQSTKYFVSLIHLLLLVQEVKNEKYTKYKAFYKTYCSTVKGFALHVRMAILGVTC